GFREYQLNVKDLRTGAVLPDHVAKVAGCAWAADNRTCFYVTEDAAKRPYRLYRHTLGTDVAKDALVLEEKDELFRLGVERSRDKKFVFAQYESETSSEWRFLPSGEPAGEFKTILAREP